MTLKERNPSEITLALNAWWRTQRRWRTKSQAAADLGIPKSTFLDYFNGAEPKSFHREKLYGATRLDVFAPPKPQPPEPDEESPSVNELEARLAEVAETLRLLSDQFGSLHEVLEHMKIATRPPGRILPFRSSATAEMRAEGVEQLTYSLIAALETFRKSAADRQLLRTRLHGPDVGYLLALMNALLDEEKFQSWSSISSYRPLGVRR